MENHVQKQRRIRRAIWGSVWLTLIALYLIAPWRHLNDYAWDYDEGPTLQAAALAFQGYPLYAEVVLNKLPFLAWFLEASFALGGMTLTTARLAMLLLTLVGFISLGVLAELWWGEGAGAAAMALYLLIPESPVRAMAVMSDLPAMSAALVALTFATLFRQRRRLHWLIASAVAYSIAVGLHPLLLFIGAPLIWILGAPEAHGALDFQRLMRVLAVFGVTGCVIFAGTLLLVDKAGFFRWVYAYNTVSAETEGVYFPAWEYIRDYLHIHWAFVAVALSGILLLRRRFWISTALIWAFMTLTSLYLYRPLWEHYLIFLLYPCVVIAGGAVAAGLRWRLPWSQLALAVVSLCLMLVPGLQKLTVPVAWPTWPLGHEEAYAYLTQEGAGGEFIVSDDPFLAFVHGYSVPPALADTSFKRIRNGYLNIGDVVQAMREYQAHYLVLDMAGGRLQRFPDLMSGIEAISDLPQCFATLCIYRARPLQPADAVLGDIVRLVGYTISPATRLRRGDTLTVTLYWESLAPPGEDLSVFVHVLAADGTMMTQHDGPPLSGLAPTLTWREGMVVPDPHPIVMTADIPAGSYTVVVGMYRWPSLERLPARNAAGERWRDNRITLTDVSVAGP